MIETPFPKIVACLICEGVRLEQNNKATFLGVYGITPFVEISLGNLAAPTQLGFVLFGAAGGGIISHAFVC